MTATLSFDGITFLREWLAAPLRVGALAPSGATLARAITAEIGPEMGPVIELGPGTGVFTRALLDRGVAERDLTLVEAGSEFAVMLEARFPEARVLWMDASRLRAVDLFGGGQAGAVVSGLPLLSMSPRKVVAILDGAFRHLKPGGAFYQFTYGPGCPAPRPILDRLGLKASRVGRALSNVPPATVYRIQRRSQRHPTEGWR
ncbi:class I SAM-dependent methyltransferase [Chenggangzhangella methanolivorans]|uniref:Methyltransferase domain-containing protein n=1 Tax=Chenggangzhangella methanolivorans TaxID=1437009 RepID=A0A9E6UPB8_9HYPH|nr:methyltransferase domain-containing protein [Chenggangzhangella methanolivorans]QZO01249.1 methyltransferase domain-containing protein [Chenggangzhangella methanolivorans]